MREIIRFAWGISSLGDFMVAMSDKGLVALEFSSNHPATEDALRVRFPEADVIDSQQGLSDVLEKIYRAIEEPGFDPAVPLDLRGTPYEVEVWSMLRAIPVGETTNYGAGGQAGHPRRAGGDRGDRLQPHRGPCAMPPRHQEGRLDLRLPLGRQAQARAAQSRKGLTLAGSAPTPVAFKVIRRSARRSAAKPQRLRLRSSFAKWAAPPQASSRCGRGHVQVQPPFQH